MSPPPSPVAESKQNCVRERENVCVCTCYEDLDQLTTTDSPPPCSDLENREDVDEDVVEEKEKEKEKKDNALLLPTIVVVRLAVQVAMGH